MRTRLRRVWAVSWKELAQIWRDRGTLAMVLIMPLLQLFLFGFAIHTSVEDIPLVVADQSLDGASRRLVEAMESSGYFSVSEYVPDEDAVIAAIDGGQANAGLIIAADYAQGIVRREAQVMILVDGSDLFTAQSAYQAATAVAQAHATELLVKEIQASGRAAAGNLVPLEARLRILYNPNLVDLWFIVPGMIAMLLQTQTIMLTASAVVREKEAGTIEQLLVTPIRPAELMLGKIMPNALIAMLNLVSIIAVSLLLFKVPFRGSFGLFAWLSLLYSVCGLGLGLLVSTISTNLKQSQQITMALSLVGVVLGGFLFPRYAMPRAIRIFSNLFPMTHFIEIARGIITKGNSLALLREQVITMIAYMILIIVGAAKTFRQNLD